MHTSAFLNGRKEINLTDYLLLIHSFWNDVDNILENSFSGGTDGEQMLAEAIRVLQKGTYEMADVLIILDFEFTEPVKETMEKINKEKTLGTRFYGLRIGQHGIKAYETKILDKMWTT